jgi:acetylornithine deacetylase/succinyl-diaminopimelate desuccinylase-like protein
MKTDFELLDRLLRIPSVSGDIPHVNEAVDFLRDYLVGKGVECAVETMEDGRKILYATTLPGCKTPDYLFNSHLDVVPADDPAMFVPVVKDGRVYARGAEDCKGNAVVAAQILVDLNGKASVGAVFATDEETGGRTSARMVELGYVARKMVMVLDAGAYHIVNAQKGIRILKIRAKGCGGHSSRPWAFQNPIEMLFEGYARLRAAWPEMPEDKWGDSVAPCMIASGFANNQIPDEAEMTLNIRFVTPGDSGRIIQMAREAFTGCEVASDGATEPVFCDEDHPEMRRLQEAMKRRFPGKEIPFTRMMGATDARHYTNAGAPIAMIGIVGDGAHAHVEWSDLASMDEYADLLEDFVSQK